MNKKIEIIKILGIAFSSMVAVSFLGFASLELTSRGEPLAGGLCLFGEMIILAFVVVLFSKGDSNNN